MRTSPVQALAAATIMLGAFLMIPASAQAQDASWDPLTQHKQVLGFQDQVTGAFHPLTTVIPEATTAPITGTITVTLHITLKTAVPTGAKVGCSGDVLASYTSALGATVYTELAEAFASVSGATATCVITIPHSWQFPPTTTTDIESLSGSYSAVILNPGATTTTQLPFVRESSSGFVALSGNNIFATAPSTFSVNVTL